MKLTKYLAATAMAASLAATLGACASSGPYDDLSPQRYINRASSFDSFEALASQMALQQSQNPQVRAYAQQMIADNAQSAQLLATNLAGRSDQTVAIPAPGLMLPEQRAALASLQMSTNFDHDYLMTEASALDSEIAMHNAFAGDSDNALLVKYAKAVVPTAMTERTATGQLLTAPMAMAPAPILQPTLIQ